MIMYKSLNKSLQIIRSITMNNKKFTKNYHYAIMSIFQKNCGHPGGGESEYSDTCGQEGEGVINGQNLRTLFIDGPFAQLMI